jgi:hypothetical protein
MRTDPIAFGVVIAGAIAVHWAVLIRARLTKRPVSVTPVVIGLIGAILAVMDPVLRAWCWVPILLDPGCAPMFAEAIFGHIRDRRSMGSSPLTVHKLQAILVAEQIRPSNYNLGHAVGGVIGDDECHHLVQRNGKWAVYYSERGSEHGLRMFETESAACEYLLDRLLKEPDAR